MNCPLCGVAVVVEGKGMTHSYSLDPKIREAMDVIHGVEYKLYYMNSSKDELYEMSLQLELALKRLNELVLGGEGYYLKGQ